MMGFSLSGDQVPIVKASNNILVMRERNHPAQPGLSRRMYPLQQVYRGLPGEPAATTTLLARARQGL